MSNRVDLHTHSNASDGTCTPTEVARGAAKAGLAGLALTDHDTLAGIAEARAACALLGIRFLAGIELSTHWGNLDSVHLLGYRVDEERAGPLVAACSRLRDSRQERGRVMVAKLNDAGLSLRFSEVRGQAGTAAIGRPHVARVLVAGGWARSIQDAFDTWLIPGRPGYVAQDNIEAGAAVELLRACGAAPILAHPQTLELSPKTLEDLTRDLVGHGLSGIEAYWSQQEPLVIDLCERLAHRYGLLATGGSDFHGENKPNRIGDTPVRLDLALMAALESAAER